MFFLLGNKELSVGFQNIPGLPDDRMSVIPISKEYNYTTLISLPRHTRHST